MNTQDLIKTLVATVQENPELLGKLMEHPYSTIGDLTDNDNVSKEEASQAVTAMAALAGGKDIDFGGLASVAAQLLASNGGSVHALANALLGNGTKEGVDVSEGVSTDIISNLAKAAQSFGSAKVDLSDGIGLDDLMGLAGALLGGKK